MFRQVTGTTAGREHTTKTDNEQFFKTKCKLSCCSICTFCARAFPKERNKSRASRVSLQKSQIKICERCFVCYSIVLCSVTNVKNAVSKLPVGARLLANLAGPRSRSESCSNPERGLHPPLSDPAKTHEISQS